ncbi:hypothetical protein GQ457_12G010450 [Hibiscus cannabinus]
MATKELVGIFGKSLFRSSANSKTAAEIAEILIKSGLKPFRTNPSLISDLNSNTVNLILSNPNLPLHLCNQFFNFLRANLSLPSQKPNLQTHLTFIRRLYKAGNFEEIKQVLEFIMFDDSLRYSIEDMFSIAGFECDESNFPEKFSDLFF